MRKIIVFISAIIVVIVNVLIPYFLGNLVDNVQIVYLSLFFTVILSKMIFSMLSNILWQSKVLDEVSELRNKCMDKLLKIKNKDLEKFNLGKISAIIIYDIDNIMDIKSRLVSTILIGGFSSLFILIYLFIINKTLFIILLLATPIIYVVNKIINKASYKSGKRTANIRDNMQNYFRGMVDNVKEDRNFKADSRRYKEIKNITDKYYHISVKNQFLMSLTNPLVRFLNAILYVIIVLISAFYVIDGKISLGVMVAFMKYTSDYMKPFNEIASMITEYQGYKVSKTRIKEFLELEEESTDGEHFSSGDIIFNNVEFSYNDKDFIKDFNLTIKSNKKIAIIGETGSGKTTIISLLLKMYDIKSGEISIDGKNIQDISTKELRDNIATVTQNSYLFDDTIDENISFGKVFDKEELKNYFYYETDRSIRDLSSGEKQMICILRAIVKKAPIVILDEATSDLDSRSELIINDTFDKIIKNKTAIIIAHRLKTIRNADLIIVMKNGKVVEKGTDKELLENNGYYKELIDKM